MSKLNTYNTYVSVTVYVTPTRKYARIYTCVESCQLHQHLHVDYKDGKRELAKLMLRFMEMPQVRRYDDGWTAYSMDKFLD